MPSAPLASGRQPVAWPQRVFATWTFTPVSGTSIKPVSDGTEQFARSIDDSLLSVDNGTTASLVGTDTHRDLAYVADPDGTVTGNRVYDPFGTVQVSTGAITSTLGYQSDVTDATTGNVWMGARWYGPHDDTFLSEDSVTGMTAEPESLNRYTYANGDPIENVDLDGHAAIRMLALRSPLMRGSDVRAAQARLHALGYSIATDGIFGRHTHDAVVSFQSKHSLDHDGIVGPKTLAKLCPSARDAACQLLLAPLFGSSSPPHCGGTDWLSYLTCTLTSSHPSASPPRWEQKVAQCQKQATGRAGTKACDEGAFLYLKSHAPAGRSKALSDVPAAAVVGNWIHESGGGHVNPYSIEDRKVCTSYRVAGCGIGFAQWTYAPRKQGLLDRAAKRGVKWSNFRLQLDYALYEMGRMGNFYKTLQGYSGRDELARATNYVEVTWERPRDPKSSFDRRYSAARGVLKAYGGGA